MLSVSFGFSTPDFADALVGDVVAVEVVDFGSDDLEAEHANAKEQTNRMKTRKLIAKT